MSRHRRANSDLYGLKSVKNNKSHSFKQSQSTLSKPNLQAYEPKSSHSKKSNCPETPTKKADPQQHILDTYRLVKHFYQNEDPDYYSRVKKYIQGEWESHKKNFNEHLNKLTYMEEQMQKKNYNQIQLQIISEWRKNPVLYCIRAFWYEHIGNINYSSIGDLLKKYNVFKDFVGQLAYLYFRRFFLSLGSSKQIQKVLDKLSQRTSHLIITYTSTWCKISDKKVIPLLKLKFITPEIQNFQISKFDLDSLGIKTFAVNYKAKQIQMPKTIDSIQKFVIQHKMLQKIKLILDIRKNMESQIMNRQQSLVQSGELKEIKVLDKDDFVDCLIYCVVKGDIPLDKLGLSIKYFYYLLGADANIILSKFRCDSYLADLEAVYEFFVQKAKNSNLNQSVAQSTNDNQAQKFNQNTFAIEQSLINSNSPNYLH